MWEQLKANLIAWVGVWYGYFQLPLNAIVTILTTIYTLLMIWYLIKDHLNKRDK